MRITAPISESLLKALDTAFPNTPITPPIDASADTVVALLRVRQGEQAVLQFLRRQYEQQINPTQKGR